VKDKIFLVVEMNLLRIALKELLILMYPL
jgi:hypothetical protein